MKKNSGINLAAMAQITADEENQKKREAAFINAAPLRENHVRKPGGRPKKENKAEKAMVAYFTEEEAEKVKEFCGAMPFSTVVRQLLQEKGAL